VRIKPLRAPRLVRRNDPVVKVTLESGAEIVCTPDHRFMLRDGTYREAQQLKAKDQLMPFSRTAIPERLHRTGAFPIPASLTQRVTKVEPAGRADVYDLTVDDLGDTVAGPDFPGGGAIYRFDEQRNVETGAVERVDAIRRAYAQGRGRVIARAKAHNEQLRGNRDAIVVTELPYAVNKAS